MQVTRTTHPSNNNIEINHHTFKALFFKNVLSQLILNFILFKYI